MATKSDSIEIPKKTAEKFNNEDERKSDKFVLYLRTGMLILCFTAYGLANNMVISCLPDYRERFNCTVGELSSAKSIGSLGTFVAMPLSFLQDRYIHCSNLFIGASLVLAGAANLVPPYWDSLIVFSLCEFVDDICWATIENIANTEIPRMWRGRGQSAMLAMHLGYPIGAAAGAQIASYFVSKKLHKVQSNMTINMNSTSSYLTLNSTLNNSLANDIYNAENRGPIENGFIIGFVYISVVAIVFICLQCFKTYVEEVKQKKKLSNWKDILTPSKWSDRGSYFGIKIFLFFVLYAIFLSGAGTSMSFITLYAVDSNLGFDPPEAARMSAIATLMDAIFTLFCAVCLTRFFSVRTMLIIVVHGIFIACFGALTFGTKYKIALYVFVALFKMCRGPCYASIFSWVDHYIVPLVTLLGVVRVIRNGSYLLLVRVQGYLYDHIDIESIFYTSVGYTGAICLSAYVIYYVTYRVPFRYEEDSKVSNESAELVDHSAVGTNSKIETKVYNK